MSCQKVKVLIYIAERNLVLLMRAACETVCETVMIGAALGAMAMVPVGGFGIVVKDTEKRQATKTKQAKQELKKQHMQAMRQAASLSLVGAYSLQFLESPTYSVQWRNGLGPAGINYANFGNACLKGTEFDPNTSGAAIDVVDAASIKVNSVEGHSLSLEYSDKLGRFTPSSREDKEITQQKQCSYSLRNFGARSGLVYIN